MVIYWRRCLILELRIRAMERLKRSLMIIGIGTIAMVNVRRRPIAALMLGEVLVRVELLRLPAGIVGWASTVIVVMTTLTMIMVLVHV